jgi:hypothetical protein
VDIVNKPEEAAAAYIAFMCLELRMLAQHNNLRYLAILLEAANLEAGMAQFDLETHVRDNVSEMRVVSPIFARD